MDAKKPAVFLDRDGVIIEEVQWLTKPEQVKVLPNAGKAIAKLNKSFLVIIISNQPVVGRGMCTEEDVKNANDVMLKVIAKDSARIDAIYNCFHHPIHGIGKYKAECECRKPKPGMTLQAAKDFNIDLKSSFTIGDKIGDIKAGFLAGTKTILVQTGYGGKDGFNDAVPDYVAKDLYSAVNIIMGETK
ncbi:MAG TPA: HAD family hydrolase [Nanoarchaeota archaeon]|nr:HAD family hydrolase [Nanoarchaeota archaeon]